MLLSRLVLILAGFAVSAGACELALRLFAPQPLESPLDIYAPSSAFGHLLKPNLEARRLTTSEWMMHVTTNSRGFRGSDHIAERSARERRIVGIGDSFMFGYGVEENETALARIAAGLEERSGIAFEAINLGVPGHGPTQYLDILQNEGARYQPDLVIATLFLNDLRAQPTKTPYQVENGHLVTERFELSSTRSALLPLRGVLKRRSHAYVFVRDRMTSLLQKLGLRPLERPEHYVRGSNLASRYAHTFDVVRSMGRFCNRRGYRLLVFLVPEKQQVLDWYRQRVLESYPGDPQKLDWGLPQAALLETCRNEGIECLDLRAPLRRSAAGPLYFAVDLHWTRVGHAVAAAAAIERLGELGWFEEGP